MHVILGRTLYRLYACNIRIFHSLLGGYSKKKIQPAQVNATRHIGFMLAYVDLLCPLHKVHVFSFIFLCIVFYSFEN